MDPVVIPIIALLIPMVIVPTALAFKHARYLREVEHAERMRAMELGRTLAEDESWTPASIALTIGAAVPMASMLIAWLATRSMNMVDAPIEIIWKMAGMVGLGGVICGSVLASQLFLKGDRAATVTAPDEKPAYDPDEFDVVGRRG